MSDDEVRSELQAVKADLVKFTEHMGTAPTPILPEGRNLIHSAIDSIDKLLKHFDPGIPLKPKS